MNCTKCGERIREGKNFCLRCGAPVSSNMNQNNNMNYTSQNTNCNTSHTTYRNANFSTNQNTNQTSNATTNQTANRTANNAANHTTSKTANETQANNTKRTFKKPNINTNAILNFLASPMGRIAITIACMLLIFGILVLMLQIEAGWSIVIAILVCAVFGWKALNRITPAMFLIGNMDFWVLYFIVKGLISAMIGLFVAPFQIGKMISGVVNDIIEDSVNQ